MHIEAVDSANELTTRTLRATGDALWVHNKSGEPGTTQFLQLALQGRVTGVRRVVFGGFNADIDTATTPEDVWGSDGLIPRPSSAESLEIVSSDVNDTALGTGARTVVIRTLDANYLEVVQTVVLNGTLAVALTGTHLRVNEGIVATAGSAGANLGALTIRVAGGGATRAVISTTGVLNQAKYTVPAGHHLDLLSVLMSVRTSLGNESVVLAGATINPAGRTLTAVRFTLYAAGTSLFRHEIGGGTIPFFTLTAQNEISWRALQVTQNNTAVEVAVLGLLYDEAFFPLT